MRILPAALVITLALTVQAMPGAAAPESSFAVVVLHANAHDAKGAVDVCGTTADYLRNTDCSNYTTTWPLNQGADVYLVAAEDDPSGSISVITCGIDYDSVPASGADVFGWTLCADVEFPTTGPNGLWPAAGSGNRIAWDASIHCQVSPGAFFPVNAVGGAFYVFAYSEDHFQVTLNNQATPDPELSITDCGAVTWQYNYFHAGEVIFSNSPNTFAYHPCPFPDPVKRASWGAVKALY